MEQNAQKILEDLLEQNKQLRLEVAVLRTNFEQLKDIRQQMIDSQKNNFTPEVMEMLSKLDIR